MTGGCYKARTTIAKGVGIAGSGHHRVGRERDAEGLNEQLITGTKARLQGWVQVQQGNHRGWRGESKFDIKFGLDKHWL